MHEHYWERLAELDREETARRAGCARLPECDSFAISLLNRRYVADLGGRKVCAIADSSAPRPAGYLEQLCILAYLVHAQDLPLAGKLVTAEKLDPGGFFFRGSHRLAVEKLEEIFGQNPQLLCEVGRLFEAAPRAFGDASIELLVLPRIPSTLIIWAGDEEFSARASVLFDRTASLHLPLDVLYAAGTLTINAVASAAKQIP